MSAQAVSWIHTEHSSCSTLQDESQLMPEVLNPQPFNFVQLLEQFGAVPQAARESDNTARAAAKNRIMAVP